ncbi:hypothetical protein DAI22_02g360900 [Oryza sativa Japonica Group]|nr:hypothetical protein DAI22_02g360900 [Oryza sativa Japonica Group]
MPVQNHEKIMEDALKREFQHCMFSHAPPRVHIQQSQDPPELEINLGMAVDDGAPVLPHGNHDNHAHALHRLLKLGILGGPDGCLHDVVYI